MTQPAAIPLRVLRAMVEASIGRRPLTETQRAREADIVVIATEAMVRFGRAKIRFKPLAQSLRMCVDTLRWHFADVDDLLGAILRRHVRSLQEAVGAVAAAAPDRRPRLHAALQTAAAAPAHVLLLRDRMLLPEDVRGPIEVIWFTLRATLAAELGPQAAAMWEDRPGEPASAAMAYPTPAAATPQSASCAARGSTARPAPPPKPERRLTMRDLNRRVAFVAMQRHQTLTIPAALRPASPATAAPPQLRDAAT